MPDAARVGWSPSAVTVGARRVTALVATVALALLALLWSTAQTPTGEPAVGAAGIAGERPVAAPGGDLVIPGRAGIGPAAPPDGASRVAVVLKAPWGAGPGELGRQRPEEGNAEGPMSFLVNRDGHVVVLDQVNRRIQVFAEGQAVARIGIPAETFQDLDEWGPSGLVLLDRLAGREVVYLDAAGRVQSRVPIVGPGVPAGGGVTGLFQRDDGTWVEVEHRSLVRIATARGEADPYRPVVPGRLAADGQSYLRAARSGRETAVVTTQYLDAPSATLLARVEFPAPILHLVALESDPRGRIHLAGTVLRRRGDQTTDEADVVVTLGPDGTELSRTTLPPRREPEEQLRPIRLGRDGALYQLAPGPQGVTVRRFTP